MADSKSGVHVLQLKPIAVPPSMLAGEKFIKWDEDSSVVTPVTLRVDPDGYFLYWTDQNDETRFLDLCSIRDTRTGRYAKVPKDVKMREQLMMGPQDLLEDKTLTVVHGPDFVNVYFVQFCATKKEIAKFWTDELLKMAYNILRQNGSMFAYLKKAYVKLTLSADKSGKIPTKNVIRLFAQHKDDRRRVEKALETLGFTTAKDDGVLKKSEFQFEHFYQLCKLLTGRNEVKEIFDNLCASKGHAIDLDQFMEFLNQHQRDPRLNELLYPYANPSRALDLISQYEPNESNAQQGLLSEEGLLRFLLGEDNSIISSDKIDLSHDMDQPLCHYFINSSHNTYLTGHQITGKSSVEIYRQALLGGCRCVELDFWNGKNDEPIIYHGYTLVPEVPARDVIEAIAESAFKTSEFPVILSFENHCNTKQQAKIAQYCREFFGEMLLDAALTSNPLEPGVPLPSPTSLKRKIIIKNKKKLPSQGKKSDKIKAELAAAAAAAALANGESSRPRLEKRESRDSAVEDDEETAAETEDAEVGSDCDDEDDVTTLSPEELRLREKAQKDKGTAGKETQAGSEISALVNYVQPIHFQSFESAERRDRSYEMSSFVESQAMALLKEHPVEFVNYNKRQLSRIYPKGTRVDSSNFLPQVFWNAGCQLVALNFQTLDLAMQLNLGIFECNGRSGYLLKPQFMRRPDRRFDPFAESMVDGIIAGTVSVQVISGQFLSDKRVSSYVEVDMFGLPADTVRKRFRTKTVFNNGVNPQYNEEPFEFKKVILPELACIRISAYEDSGRLIGHRVFPVTGLCPGYRHLLLRSESGQPLPLATLFVKIVVKDYVPDKLSMLAEALVNPIKYQSELEKRAKQLSVLMADSEDAVEDSPDGYFTDLSKSLSSPGPWTSPGSASLGGSFQYPGPSSPNTDTLTKKKDSSKKPLTPRVSLDDPAGPSSAPTSPPRTVEPLELVFNIETPEQLMEHKTIKKLKEKLQKKLEELRKEYEKEKKKLEDDPELVSKNKSSKTAGKTSPPVTLGPSEKLSHRGLDRKSSVQGRSTPEAVEQMKRQLAEKLRNDEQEQRKKYRDSIYATLEECIAESQRQQLRLLKKQHDALVNEAQKTVLAQIKTEFENINKKYSNKDEVSGARREKRDEIIKKSVAERERLQKQFAEKKDELERQFDQLRRAFQEEKSKNPLDLENGDHSPSPSDNTDPPVAFGPLDSPQWKP